MKLYELTSNYRELQMMIEDGVDPSALADTLQAIEESIQDKVQNTALVIRNLEADVDAIKAEEKRLAERRKAIENNCKSLKDYLYQQMIATDLKRIKGTIVTVGIQKNPASLDIAEDAVVPPEYMIPQPAKVDKKSLLAAVKDGMQWDGITLRQSEGVRIR
ncbi:MULTISPECIES: siphovirus Gp157 family protein [Bacillus cereus group]|uniref:Siphovirus Gp157 n=1 Tax=Bacillus pacificus TaxID=2026187 RepID=A0A1Y5YW10_9BACI|nr:MULTISPECIES: siphovirus Gp157 family protein [Bacillus cereus group]MCC2441810.1 siphovirus Gp157 family protein [Bacillus paranthracis]SMD65459.1 Siphovirus Gp157 [Bacillus pacificus]HDR7526703.1 siphovirus Gp157 family protein [Bacillus paranthracis]